VKKEKNYDLGTWQPNCGERKYPHNEPSDRKVCDMPNFQNENTLVTFPQNSRFFKRAGAGDFFF
jgi:hypothetical protein